MKAVLSIAAIFVLLAASASGQGKLLTTDPMTGLPLIGASDSGRHITGFAYTYNAPNPLPNSQVCKSKLVGEFYTLFNIKADAAVAWYSTHLAGFKKVSGYDGNRSQTVFYNGDGTVVVIVTGNHGAKGENTDAYSVAYQKYQPGLAEKTAAAIPTGNTVCQ